MLKREVVWRVGRVARFVLAFLAGGNCGRNFERGSIYFFLKKRDEIV
jgi:hypothetical protein